MKIERLVSIWRTMPSIFDFREQNLGHKFRLLQLKKLPLIKKKLIQHFQFKATTYLL